MTTARDMEIIEIPGYPGMFTRRKVVKMWQKAGSPKINSAGRLYDDQLKAYKDFIAGNGSPADNPDNPNQPLAHVRFAALDVESKTAAMRKAGFVFPYSYEPWHGELPNVRQYPIVKEDDMPLSNSDIAKIAKATAKEIFATEQPAASLLDGTQIPKESFLQRIKQIRRYVTANRNTLTGKDEK
jgi:hypothetical protein